MTTVGSFKCGRFGDELALVEIREDRAVVGPQSDVRFDINGKVECDLTVHRGKREWFAFLESDNIGVDFAIHGFDQRASGNIRELHLSIEAFNFEISGNVAD